MSVIRPLERDDLQPVADLLVRSFGGARRPASPEMADYLGRLLLDLPGKAPDINSLVHVSEAGRINGCIGVLTQPMRLGGRLLRVAAGNSLAVDPEAEDPMVGARLCRSFFRGPQDITLSDRCNAVSLAMFRKVGGVSLPSFSLDWRRVLRPIGAASLPLRQRLGFGGALVAGLDGWLAGRGKARWQLPSLPQRVPGLHRHDAGDDDLLTALPELAGMAGLHPVWPGNMLAAVLDHAAQKRAYGPMVRQIVRDGSGRLVGAYLYYLRPHGAAQVLQVLPGAGMAGVLLDVLLVDAAERGAVSIGGRAQPVLLEPLMDRGAVFSAPSRCVVGTRDEEVLAALRQGDAMLGGLVGEFWTRLNGDNLH